MWKYRRTPMLKCDNEKTKDREGGDNGETIVIEENKVVSEDKEKHSEAAVHRCS